MKLLIDDAAVDKIQRIYEYYPVDGVTTNPSILAKSGRSPYTILKEIRAVIGVTADLHVQVTAAAAKGIVCDAHRIVRELGEATYVKIPAVPEGFKAMQILHKEGIRLTATAIYTPMQAYLSAKAGADYAAPYVNRIDNLGYDGIATTKTIHDIFVNNGFATRVLAASFKNSQQVLELCRYGIGGATAACDIIENFVNHAAVTAAVEVFQKDFAALVGADKTMSDC